MVVRRGEIWWASLRKPRGSEPGYRRPIVVVQADEFNQSDLATVIGVSLSSNLRLAEASGNVLLGKADTGLKKDSVANVSQLVVVDKAFLSNRGRSVSAKRLEEIENGLRLILDL